MKDKVNLSPRIITILCKSYQPPGARVKWLIDFKNDPIVRKSSPLLRYLFRANLNL